VVSTLRLLLPAAAMKIEPAAPAWAMASRRAAVLSVPPQLLLVTRTPWAVA
jgi:hypothetical protein